jgi:hypothetical protein
MANFPVPPSPKELPAARLPPPTYITVLSLRLICRMCSETDSTTNDFYPLLRRHVMCNAVTIPDIIYTSIFKPSIRFRELKLKQHFVATRGMLV